MKNFNLTSDPYPLTPKTWELLYFSKRLSLCDFLSMSLKQIACM
ncbi:hypothetical protein LEP1GSC193_0850 [Leptospira alstonii serovar Pingchang str. 80-412]|uniref:Uncharacterized protein n=2 Tax=Leptospira alstonii TaxID=28452 RepID=M6CUL2_9LEPT|nr:hypothetical protein LEP1GSC194_3630 [Leptospira alstonii serovar Sichuan str. 79601]EQA80087.1 hypothetical protein LEP1GSC193_0850 [Leptospira alstonii serovar Pingchang str. 80-412]